uniref:Uncharacterized protein n=1 Tax=Anguilla anguilla TaxID=7936 RepID=A0A0E9RK15_ANGAN
MTTTRQWLCPAIWSSLSGFNSFILNHRPRWNHSHSSYGLWKSTRPY